MEAKRRTTIKGRDICEYYWNGKMVVYIDNKLSSLGFDEAIEAVSEDTYMGEKYGANYDKPEG